MNPINDFPVTWRQASDADLFWSQDRLHYPDPVTPLEFSFIEGAVDAGLGKALRYYDIPLKLLNRHINGYAYFCVLPDERSTAATAALAAQSTAKLGAAMDNLLPLWQNQWLPELQQHLAFWEQYSLNTATQPELLQHLNATEERIKRVWELHFLLFLPSMLAISRFVDLYHESLQPSDAQAAYELLTGFDTKTTQSAEALWTLSRQILAAPLLTACFRQQAAGQVLGMLAEIPAAASFLADLQRYLQTHGYRANRASLDCPYWVEDATPVIKSLQDYMQQAERDWPDRQQMAARRERAVAAFYQQLAQQPPAVQTEMRRLLPAAQAGAFLKEEHGYWLDFPCMYRVRQVLLAVGQRLTAAQLLASSADVFYLQLNEVKTLLAGATVSVPALRALITERQRLAARFADCTPPAVLGTIPADPPPDDLIARMFSKIEGEAPPSPTPLAPSQMKELRGQAGSRGVARGRAKVVRRLDEASKVEPGDILVAETTSSAWSLLFASIGGLITDTGGILSHAAVVAREYGIPAVVGVGSATQRLRDGQRVEVDGNQGLIRILEI